jgi:hypothetical protein
MIRNKRTTYAACIGMANQLAIQSTIPRLAAPVRVDTVLFSCDTDYQWNQSKTRIGRKKRSQSKPTNRRIEMNHE